MHEFYKALTKITPSDELREVAEKQYAFFQKLLDIAPGTRIGHNKYGILELKFYKDDD